MAITRRSSSTVSLTRRAPAGIARGLDGLGQDQIDAVAWEDQAGIAGGLVDRHRDRAHAGLEHGGEEAAIAGLDDAAGVIGWPAASGWRTTAPTRAASSSAPRTR